MCFPQKLTEHAAGYQQESGYVLVGYKTVLKVGEVLMPWTCLYGAMEVIIDKAEVMAHRPHYHDPFGLPVHLGKPVLLSVLKQLFSVKHPIFEPHRLMVVVDGEHPFHVGASEHAAVQNEQANPFDFEHYIEPIEPMMMEYRPPSSDLPIPMQIECREGVRPKEPGVLVRVLVPENAVDSTNHVHAMIIIPPGEKETEEDIAACEQYNRDHSPLTDYHPFRPDVNFAPYFNGPPQPLSTSMYRA